MIRRLIKTDARVVDNLLDKLKFDVKKKKKEINNDKKAETKLSSYKFTLAPINGKDIETISR